MYYLENMAYSFCWGTKLIMNSYTGYLFLTAAFPPYIQTKPNGKVGSLQKQKLIFHGRTALLLSMLQFGKDDGLTGTNEG